MCHRLLTHSNDLSCTCRAFRLHSCGAGIYYEPKCASKLSDLGHAMLLVGYGSDPVSGEDYWIAKNSWVRPAVYVQ